MAIPTQPTDTSIVTMAYKDFGISQPTAPQLARAITDGLEWVKRDLSNLGHAWKFMNKKGYIITQVGVNTYSAPTDYIKYIGARILQGAFNGTCSAGSTATCTLAASYTPSSPQTQGKTIVFTGGSGSLQAAQIASYNGATRVVTFDNSLSTAVDSTSTYLVVDTYAPLNMDDTVLSLGDLTIPSISMKPTIMIEDPNSTTGTFMFNYTPDRVYAIELRYFGDLLLEDVTSSRYTTFLRQGCSVLTQGVFYWLLQDDTRREKEFGKYQGMKRQFANRWLFGYDLSKMQMTTGEE